MWRSDITHHRNPFKWLQNNCSNDHWLEVVGQSYRDDLINNTMWQWSYHQTSDKWLVTMLPCAPYIPNMCQPEPMEPEPGGQLVKKDTEVTISDVKSIKVDIVNQVDLLKTESKLRGSVESLPKEFSTFKPESPDVLRSAKILENSKKGLETSCSDEFKPNTDLVSEQRNTDQVVDKKKEQEKLGAISKR